MSFMFDSIYILRYVVKNCCLFFKTTLLGNYIPRFYDALYFCYFFSDVIEFRFVSMSVLSRCEVGLEFLPLFPANYVLIMRRTFVRLSILCMWCLFVVLWIFPCYLFLVSSRCPRIKFLIVIMVSKANDRYCICRCSEGFGFECNVFSRNFVARIYHGCYHVSFLTYHYFLH